MRHLVSFPDPTPKRKKGSGTHRVLFGAAQDAACHVIIKTTHRFGTTTHQRLSRAAVVYYSVAAVTSHASHMA